MELTKIKKQLESKSLEDINSMYASVIPKNDYKIITKLVRYLEYDSLADLIIKNLDDLNEFHKNPNHYYKIKVVKDIDNVFARCRNNWNFTDFSLLKKALYLRIHLSVFSRVIGIAFSEVLYKHKNVDGAKFIIDTLTTTKSFLKTQGATPPESDSTLLEGVKELYEGYNLSTRREHFIIPTFKIGEREDLLYKFLNVLEERNIIPDKQTFLYLLNRAKGINPNNLNYNWNETIAVLVFLFLLMIDKKMICASEAQNLTNKLCIFEKKGEKIRYDTLKTDKYRIDRCTSLESFSKSAKKKVFNDLILISQTI